MPDQRPAIGVVIVTYRSADVIGACLASLRAIDDVALHVVVVDNASPDDTLAAIRIAVPDLKPASQAGSEGVALIEAGANGGFAAGVNLGLARLAANPALDRFWLLNPDCTVPRDTPRRLATHDPGPKGAAMIAHRVVYGDEPGRIQIDGGVIDRRTGVTHNLNQFAPAHCPAPDPAQIDFVTGASLVATRAFLERAGPMAEDYFLYYEEVDWALRRGDLPITFCEGAVVHHMAGTAIGSQRMGSVASPFSQYFKHRARAIFLRRHFPSGLIGGAAWSLAKAAQLLGQGHRAEAAALLRGFFGMAPPRAVLAALSPEARQKIGR
ncbi:glycosyltransferase family 2 protein [Thioclava atlantica]|uniref:Glycosyl transferase family 2 protein n=1 Tax=Thioclava atlantica TaxID=1317124 RepID=A0A085TS76_9RHOB|nr:glycosyltransferase family 2 protein [Thioclava atlantica]KFE33573.1 glycosyl transferase family 2 protein [Thioclava atlantica]